MTEPAPDWWLTALSDFGAGMGFRDTESWTSEVLNLSVADGRYLVDVERSGDDNLLAVLRRTPLPEVETKARLLLRTCSFEHDHPFFLQAGLKGEDVLVLAARIERTQSDRLYAAFELIHGLYARMGL